MNNVLHLITIICICAYAYIKQHEIKGIVEETGYFVEFTLVVVEISISPAMVEISLIFFAFGLWVAGLLVHHI